MKYCLKGQTYEGLQNWEKAIENYTLVAESYSHDILGDDATFKLAQLYEYRLSDPQKAAEYYKKYCLILEVVCTLPKHVKNTVQSLLSTINTTNKFMQVIYNVTVSVDYDVAEHWLEWMKEEHIPEVMKQVILSSQKYQK